VTCQRPGTCNRAEPGAPAGGRAGAYEQELRKAREIALEEAKQAAQELGANAIVGVDVDYETIRGSMLMVSISGTAVIVE